MWYTGSHQPFSSTSRDHVGDKPSPSDSKVHGKKGKVHFPYRLFEGNNHINLYPYMDESKFFLENIINSHPHLSSSYQNICPNPSLVDEVIDDNPDEAIDHNVSLVNPTLSKCGSHDYFLEQPLVEKILD